MEDSRSAGGARARNGWSSVGLGVLAALAFSGLCAAPALAKTGSYLTEDRNLVDVYAAVEGAKLGVVLPGGPEKFITVTESSQNVIKTPSGPALGTTDCHDSSGAQVGPAVGCTIEIAVLPHKDGELKDTIVHEVFHAFQAVMSETLANFAGKSWLIEGSGVWVESVLVSKDNLGRIEWKAYLGSPGTPLFKRGESAVGFFGHMQSSNISPWKKFDAMFKAKSSAAAYTAAGVDKTFLDNEASVFFREPKFGPLEWDQQGPNVPSAAVVRVKPVQVNATAKAMKPLVVAPYADGVYDLTITGLPATKSVLEVTLVKGNMRLHSTSGGDVNEVDPAQTLLCSDPKGCSCPSRPNHYQKFQRGDLSITGGPTGGEVRMVALKPCEVLLPAVSCTTLLPGFGPLILSVGGKPTSTETRQPDGTTVSGCVFLYKGVEITNSEGEEAFHGLTAPLVSVLRASTDAGAIRVFKLFSSAIPGFTLSRPNIGEEAVLYTREGTSSTGAAEDGCSAFVRVHNVVASFTLYGSPGNTEASAVGSLKLLASVASKL